MRAILIDPHEQQITEVDYDGNYTSIYKHIHADTFDVVTFQQSSAKHTETVFVDDNGLLNVPHQAYFYIIGYPSPLAGYGLILGCDSQGESISTKLTLDQVNAIVTFLGGAL